MVRYSIQSHSEDTIFWISPIVNPQGWLNVFDGEVVVSFTLADQIAGDLALGQQGSGGSLFALDIDGIQQRDAVLISLVRVTSWSDTSRVPTFLAIPHVL